MHFPIVDSSQRWLDGGAVVLNTPCF